MFVPKSRLTVGVITLLKRQIHSSQACRNELSSTVDKNKKTYFVKSRYILENDMKVYNDFFPTFRDSILNDPIFTNVVQPYDKKHLQDLIDYNIPLGWRRSPIMFYVAARTIFKPENFTDEILEKTLYMCYIVHMGNWSLQLLDDLGDGTDTRDVKLCWYKRENIGPLVGFDALNLSYMMRLVLKQHFSNYPQYVKIHETLADVDIRTMMGQRMDCWKLKMDQMSMKKWYCMSEYKTAYFYCVRPFKALLHFTNIFQEDKYRLIKPLVVDMGLLMQLINDGDDAFPAPSHFGTNGTDISQGRNSWILLKALEMGNTRQHNIIKENYGKDNDDCIKAVLDVYHELGLQEYNDKCSADFHDNILKRIEDLPEDYPKEALKQSLDIFYQGVETVVA